jgi:uncharacterized protein (TIGR02996 family)
MIESLEEGLRENPDDWNAWLVYGDHLTSVGDVRGELIRLEHEHAMAFSDNARSRRLFNERRALEKPHEAAWRCELPEAFTVQLSHGFVVALEVPHELESAEPLQRFLTRPEARFLTRLGFVANSSVLRSVGLPLASLPLQHLRELSLAYVRPNVLLAEVVKATWFSRLRALHLQYCELGDSGLAPLRGVSMPRLRVLSLQENRLTAAGLRTLATMDAPELVELDLRHNPLGEEGARALVALPCAAKLKRLSLRPSDVGEGQGVLATSALPLALRRIWSEPLPPLRPARPPEVEAEAE